MGTAAVTKQRILDAAEHMFGSHGFDGTTLRSIVKEADVNLALVSYHFGSKEDLYRAVILRMSQPIIEGQRLALEQVQANGQPPSLEAVIEAYLRPPMTYLLSPEQLERERAKFFARYFMEPPSVQAILEKEFESSDCWFLDVLQRVLPEQSRLQLWWKLDAVVIVLVRTMTQIGQPHSLIKNNSDAEIERAISELIRFAVSVMRFQ